MIVQLLTHPHRFEFSKYSLAEVRSMILIQRMYYELLHHGAILRFKEYQAKNEPLFYVARHRLDWAAKKREKQGSSSIFLHLEA